MCRMRVVPRSPVSGVELMYQNASVWTVTRRSPAPGSVPQRGNCLGRVSVGSAHGAAPRRQAQSAALRYPVSWPSSRCDLVLCVVVRVWLRACAPQRHGQHRLVDPPPESKPCDAAPRCRTVSVMSCVFTSRPSRRAASLLGRCSRAPLRPLARALPRVGARGLTERHHPLLAGHRAPVVARAKDGERTSRLCVSHPNQPKFQFGATRRHRRKAHRRKSVPHARESCCSRRALPLGYRSKSAELGRMLQSGPMGSS
jgi:hypothetical protein